MIKNFVLKVVGCRELSRSMVHLVGPWHFVERSSFPNVFLKWTGQPRSMSDLRVEMDVQATDIYRPGAKSETQVDILQST